jgi:hypothetical protein
MSVLRVPAVLVPYATRVVTSWLPSAATPAMHRPPRNRRRVHPLAAHASSCAHSADSVWQSQRDPAELPGRARRHCSSAPRPWTDVFDSSGPHTATAGLPR